jgi:hypothetical protein
VIRFSTNEMGEFALGGYRNALYVPLVVGSYTGSTSAAEVDTRRP